MEYTCTGRLKEIRVPMVLIYGEKDSGFHKYSRILKNNLQHCTLHFIKNAKHQLPTKWAHPMNKLVRQWIQEQQFLKKPRPTSPPMHQDIRTLGFEPASSQEEQFQQE
jgi:hypothetical protein